MADEPTPQDTLKRSNPDLPKPIRKWAGTLKVVGGIAVIPLLMLLGEFLFGMVGDGVKHVEELGNRVVVLETNASSKDAIWIAIHKNEGDLAASIEANHEMEVKYEAAMLVFEKHFLHGGCAKMGMMGGGHGNDLLLETLQKTLREVQKAESADQVEIEKLHEELEKLKSQQSKANADEKRQAEILKALKDVPGLRAKGLRERLDAESFRKAYEDKFPIQEQLQIQRPRK